MKYEAPTMGTINLEDYRRNWRDESEGRAERLSPAYPVAPAICEREPIACAANPDRWTEGRHGWLSDVVASAIIWEES